MLNVLDEAMKDSKNEENQTVIRWVISKRLKLMALGSNGAFSNNFRFTGEQLDPRPGFYYLRARYMNPSTGGFVSMDSYSGNSSSPISLHKYLYTHANPVMGRDPSGYSNLQEQSVVTSEAGGGNSIAFNGSKKGMDFVARVKVYSLFERFAFIWPITPDTHL